MLVVANLSRHAQACMLDLAEFAGAVVGCGRMGAFPSDVIRRFAPACWLPLGHCEAMSAHPDIELKALYTGSYEETMTKYIAAYRARTAPNLVQV